MFHTSRSELRQQFFDAWQAHQAKRVLTEAEKNIIEVLLMHPEYQALLEDPEEYLEKEYFPELGEANPFLHLSLHLSLRDQIVTDRPPGIQAIYHSLLSKADPHSVEHWMIEPLATTIWLAQKNGSLPNEQDYLDEIRKLLT